MQFLLSNFNLEYQHYSKNEKSVFKGLSNKRLLGSIWWGLIWVRNKRNKNLIGSIEVPIDRARPDEEHVKASQIAINF